MKDRAEIQKILEAHGKWLRDEPGGRRADLRGADLQGADLQGAYLRGADLQGADLQGAHLRGAYLRGADLRGAYLQGAYLRGADLQSRFWYVCPPSGEFQAWKALKGGYIAHLEIPAFARRLTALGSRKCRSECAIVLGIYEMTKSGPRPVQEANAKHDGKTLYRVGSQVWPDSFDDDPRIECSHGIHFFMTRAEAESW